MEIITLHHEPYKAIVRDSFTISENDQRLTRQESRQYVFGFPLTAGQYDLLEVLYEPTAAWGYSKSVYVLARKSDGAFNNPMHKPLSEMFLYADNMHVQAEYAPVLPFCNYDEGYVIRDVGNDFYFFLKTMIQKFTKSASEPTDPVQISQNYQPFGRKLLTVDELPGAVPRNLEQEPSMDQ